MCRGAGCVGLRLVEGVGIGLVWVKRVSWGWLFKGGKLGCVEGMVSGEGVEMGLDG